MLMDSGFRRNDGVGQIQCTLVLSSALDRFILPFDAKTICIKYTELFPKGHMTTTVTLPRLKAPTRSKREHLLRVAVDLFNEHGFHATGVDLIMTAAKMSKKTIYSYYRSKGELILAALRYHDGVFRNDFMSQVERKSPDPMGRLLAIFDTAEGWFCSPTFYGCIFVNAAGEFPEADSPIRQVCRDFKRMMLAFIRDQCRQIAVDEPDRLAAQLAMVFEGAIVTAQVSGAAAAVDTAHATARTLIDAALQTSPAKMQSVPVDA